MINLLRVLIVDDSDNDAQLIMRYLRAGGYDPIWKKVDTLEAMESALDQKQWDVILCDYKMPRFTTSEALELIQDRGIDIPFIIVSGAIGEDTAVTAMKSGAHDYLMKDNLSRLVVAIEREIREAKIRREKKKAEEDLNESEENFRHSLDDSPLGIRIVTADGKTLYANREILNIYGCDNIEELATISHKESYTPESYAQYEIRKEKRLRGEHVPSIYEVSIIRKDGKIRHLEVFRKQVLWNGEIQFQTLYNDITERKRAEEELRFRNVLLATQQEVSIDGILVVDENDRILLYNRRFVEMMGLPPKLVEDRVDEPVQQFVTAQMADPRSFLQRVQYLYEHRQETSRDELALADGRFFDRYSAPMIGSDKRYFGRVWYFRDITERKQAEDELRISEERYRMAEAIGHIGNWEYNLQTTKFWGSDEANRIYGFDPEDLDFSTDEVENCIPERERVHQALVDLIERDKPYNLEFEIHPKNSLQPRIISSIAELKLDEHGNPLLVTGVIQDITKRKQDESARVASLKGLLESQERYKALFDHSLNLIYIIDFDGQFIDANSAALNTFGYKREEIRSVNMNSIMHEDQLPLALEIIREITETGIQKDPREIRLRNKGGREIYLETQGSIVMSKGKPAAIQMIARDITERKHAEEELRESEERYRLIAENTADTIAVFDLNLNPTYISPSILKLRGYTVEEVMTQTLDQMLTPDSLQKASKVFTDEMVLESSPTADPARTALMELEECCKDGSTVWVELAASFLRDNNFKPAGILTVTRNITERKRAEEALRQSEEKFRILMESSPTAIMLYQNNKWVYANPVTTEITGYTEQELRGMDFWDIVHPDDKQLVHERGQKRQRGEAVPNRYVFRVISKDGNVKWVDLSGATVVIGGSPAGIISVFDITERKQAEEALRNSEGQLRTLVQTIPDLIWLKDPNGVYLSCNTMFERFFGASEEAIVGKTDYDFIDRKLADSFRENDRNAMAAGKPTSNEEWITFADDGHRALLDTIKTPMYNIQGMLIGVLGIGRDITDRKQASERIKKTLEATVQAIAVTVETRDPYTAGHQRRVADLVRAIATEMKLSIDIIEGLRMAASIHDLGKISVPAEILSKPTKLTDIEFMLIKTHSQSGYDILKDIDFPWPLAQIVYQHHERMDGSGYPRNLKGDEILMEARIMAVADTMEAMASHRPYRPSLGIGTALEEIEKNKGILYDDAVADACIRLFREKGYQLI